MKIAMELVHIFTGNSNVDYRFLYSGITLNASSYALWLVEFDGGGRFLKSSYLWYGS